ncbi:MAG: GIY-YIG nuclease family protein [Methanoregula sp.]|jgi:Uri superfamily endonuclease|nr:GIY-YIG nuclease family protein [Methanoregula sp.]
MDKGVYCLVFENHEGTFRVGALGDLTFRAGWHIYVGSALGSGGLKRLGRHISLARLRDKQPKWHVDYLLTNPGFSLRYAIFAVTQERCECRLAQALRDSGIPGFGCSDCSCSSHLLFRQQDPREEILNACRELKLNPDIKTIMSSRVKDNI